MCGREREKEINRYENTKPDHIIGRDRDIIKIKEKDEEGTRR
jgi:hypothetical protein